MLQIKSISASTTNMSFCFRHRKSTTEQENTFSVLSCGVETQPADMNPDSFHHSRRSVTIHLPSLTSPWSLRRTLAPWRQRRARKASTPTHTRGNLSFYPLSDLWLHTQNGKPAWGSCSIRSHLNLLHYTTLNTLRPQKVSPKGYLKQFLSASVQKWRRRRKKKKNSTGRTEILTLMSLWIFFCACK